MLREAVASAPQPNAAGSPPGNESIFPLRMPLRGPSPRAITDQFEQVRAWAADLTATSGLTFDWQEVRHRVQGVQRLPVAVVFASADDAVGWLGKRREGVRFAAVLDATRARHPALIPWLARRPLLAVELSDDWPRLMAVIDWLIAHPQPGVYLRQVDAVDVHSKFIEAHRRVLAELLDIVLPDGAVDRSRSGASQFAGRYGFRDKPVRIRFRVLDPAIRMLATPAEPAPSASMQPDVTLDADSFDALATIDGFGVERIFITENEINFLAFPPSRRSIVVFGAGYGWDVLGRIAWLHQRRVLYWGDIDTHGFAILDQLRAWLPAADSLLMDRDTLIAHAALWGTEDRPIRSDLTRLTAAERAVYDDLRDNRIRDRLRLEQERIAFGWVRDRLAALHARDGSPRPLDIQ